MCHLLTCNYHICLTASSGNFPPTLTDISSPTSDVRNKIPLLRSHPSKRSNIIPVVIAPFDRHPIDFQCDPLGKIPKTTLPSAGKRHPGSPRAGHPPRPPLHPPLPRGRRAASRRSTADEVGGGHVTRGRAAFAGGGGGLLKDGEHVLLEVAGPGGSPTPEDGANATLRGSDRRARGGCPGESRGLFRDGLRSSLRLLKIIRSAFQKISAIVQSTKVGRIARFGHFCSEATLNKV